MGDEVYRRWKDFHSYLSFQLKHLFISDIKDNACSLKYILIILKNKKKKSHLLEIASVNHFDKYPSKTPSVNIYYTVVGLGIRPGLGSQYLYLISM